MMTSEPCRWCTDRILKRTPCLREKARVLVDAAERRLDGPDWPWDVENELRTTINSFAEDFWPAVRMLADRHP